MWTEKTRSPAVASWLQCRTVCIFTLSRESERAACLTECFDDGVQRSSTVEWVRKRSQEDSMGEEMSFFISSPNVIDPIFSSPHMDVHTCSADDDLWDREQGGAHGERGRDEEEEQVPKQRRKQSSLVLGLLNQGPGHYSSCTSMYWHWMRTCTTRAAHSAEWVPENIQWWRLISCSGVLVM